MEVIQIRCEGKCFESKGTTWKSKLRSAYFLPLLKSVKRTVKFYLLCFNDYFVKQVVLSFSCIVVAMSILSAPSIRKNVYGAYFPISPCGYGHPVKNYKLVLFYILQENCLNRSCFSF